MNFEWFTNHGREYLSELLGENFPTYFISYIREEKEFFIIVLIAAIFLFYTPYEKWRVDKSKKKLIELSKHSISDSDDAKLLFSKLRRLDPFLFEELILTAIDKFNPNVKVIRNKRYTGDGGVDGIIEINNVRIAIQAKRYVNFINTTDVTNFNQVLPSVGASYGLFVHTGKTRSATWQKNSGSNVIIVSGARMLALVIKGKLPAELLNQCS